ncbi:MAG: winged helix-turn-helix transcriptional regulator [Chloroflexi bacterium]|nr:winged helix-turn-helix transcriptional regulator [Chloroflexota bacterium]
MTGQRNTNKSSQSELPAKTDDPLSDPDFSLWSMFHQTRQLMYLVREGELSEYGISTIEASVLFVIKAIEQRGRPATPGEIARWLFRRPHTISQLVNRMEKRGLVTKETLQDTRNSKRIEVTERGAQAYRMSLERRSVHRILSALSDEDRQRLWSCLDKLYKKSSKELGLKYKEVFPRPAAGRP